MVQNQQKMRSETLVEKWQPAIEFLGNNVLEEKKLDCCKELEYIRGRYLNGEFKTDSPFSMNAMYSAETEMFHEEIKKCIIKFSNEKENSRI
jgi:hypothetical protein